MKAIAIDDEPLALELIATFCAQFPFVEFDKSFTNTTAARQYLDTHVIDLLFLDIHMPAVSGIDFYKSLPQKPMLILSTSYSEFALEGFELQAVDYLLKPFTVSRFEKAITRAYELYQLKRSALTEQPKYLLLKADYGVIKVSLADILFVEGLDNYLKIYLHGQQPVVVRLTMKALLEKLDEKDFIRVHRSYIVCLHRIDMLKQKVITIGEDEIPVGKNYEESLKKALSRHKN